MVPPSVGDAVPGRCPRAHRVGPGAPRLGFDAGFAAQAGVAGAVGREADVEERALA